MCDSVWLFLLIFFNIGRGQGDPIWPYIFILWVEILGILIRNCNDIKGVKISNIELKVIQYADDTALILDGTDNSLSSFVSVKSILQIFWTETQHKENKMHMAWFKEA